jgi:hypothetical protein
MRAREFLEGLIDTPVERLVRTTARKMNMSPRAINNGWCWGFAKELARKLGNEAEVISTNDLEGVFPGHSVVLYRGRYYDAESPAGVVDPRDLHYSKRIYSLNESAVSDVQHLLKIAAAGLDGQIHREGSEMVRAYVRMEAGLSPHKSEDDQPDPENMDELISEWCAKRVAEVYYDLEYMGRRGFIPAWRVVTAPKTWKPSDWEHPGFYWSWDRDAAEAHWGEPQEDFTTWEMHADIPVGDIDWLITVIMNADPSYSEEKEIRVKQNTTIEIKSVVDLE